MFKKILILLFAVSSFSFLFSGPIDLTGDIQHSDLTVDTGQSDTNNTSLLNKYITPYHFLNISTPMIIYSGINQQISPMIYTAPTFGLDISYEHRGVNFHNTGFCITAGPYIKSTPNKSASFNLDTREIELWENDTQLHIEFKLTSSYHRSLWHKKVKKVRFYVGAIFNLSGNISLLFGIPYWILEWSLSPSIMIEFVPNQKHRLLFQTYIPLLIYLGRNPYSGINDDVIGEGSTGYAKSFFTGYITSINDYLSFTFKVLYELNLYKRLNFICSYEFKYIYAPNPRTAIIFKHYFTAGLSIRLKEHKKLKLKSFKKENK